MDKYKLEIVCPKCGMSEFSSQFCDPTPPPSCGGHNINYDEVIIRTCINCKYSILQRPLDYEGPDELIKESDMKTYNGVELEIPGYYWWLPVCSSGKENEPSHWNIVSWHPKDDRRHKLGIFVGPLEPPVDIVIK